MVESKMNERLHRIVALAACSALGLSATQSFGHHSYSQFDASKCLSLVGTVRNLEMNYPHVWLWLNVTDSRGATDTWGFEGASPVILQRLGWTKTSLKVGDKVTLRYSPLRDGRHGGSFASVQLPDGRELQAGSPACTNRK
jgi:hypothetical protein